MIEKLLKTGRPAPQPDTFQDSEPKLVDVKQLERDAKESLVMSDDNKPFSEDLQNTLHNRI
jgi:hypothetical protein